VSGEATYDVVIIGAGPVGENVADRVVTGGLSAAVVEQELGGGECSYWACMPTKALLRSGTALRAAGRLGVTATLDPGAVLRRRDRFASHWKDDVQVAWLEQAGIDLVRGHGQIAAPRTVIVTDEGGGETTLTAQHAVVIATGSAALLPDVPGLIEARPVDHDLGTVAGAALPADGYTGRARMVVDEDRRAYGRTN